MLDAINSWNLVVELNLVNPYKVYSASFKHTSPAGVAYNRPITELEEVIYNVKDSELENVSRAYILSRNCDPKSSFGDFVSLSDIVSVQCARLIKREVCDGIIAPGYDAAALEILQSKKNGNFVILKGDMDYTTQLIQEKNVEVRNHNGIVLVQNSNNVSPASNINASHIVSDNKTITDTNYLDLILANTSLKYAQSNTVSMAINGQCVVACGQQNRVDCTKLSGEKLMMMLKRQSSQVNTIYKLFKCDVMRQTCINVITEIIEGNSFDSTLFLDGTKVKEIITETININLTNMNICLASDAFFPFEDNIDVANKYGVKHIVQPGGSIRDQQIINKVNSYNMTMICTGNRLFLH
jgi:phosphoribosylaminoimidazolecarboxamide formyltransferase/IMP cyclohydrolase